MRRIQITLVILFLFYTFSIGQKTGSLTVSVKDINSQEPVSMACVCFCNNSSCKESDTTGQVTFTGIASGIYYITASGFGYEQSPQKKIRIRKNVATNVAIALDHSCSTDLEKVPSTQNRKDTHLYNSAIPQYRLNDSLLTITGNTNQNILNILAKAPGVMNIPFDNFFHVRGGTSDENVFLIDGIEFENINHFSSLFTSGMTLNLIHTDIIRQLAFYSGGFPVSSPPRLSSITDINTRSGSLSYYNFTIESNSTGLGFTAEGPISPKLSFLSSAHCVSFKPLMNLLHKRGTTRFIDALLKFEYSPNPANTIKALGIGTFDDLEKENSYFDKYRSNNLNELQYQAGGMISWVCSTNVLQNELLVSGSAYKQRKYDDITNLNEMFNTTTVTSNYSEYNRTNRDTASSILSNDTVAGLITCGSLSENRDLTWHGKIQNNLTVKINKSTALSTGFSVGLQRYRLKRAYTYESSGEVLYLYNHTLQPLYQFNTIYTFVTSTHSTLNIPHVAGFAEYSTKYGIINTTIGVRGDYYDCIGDYGISPRIQFHITPTNGIGNFLLSCGHYYQFPFRYIDYIYSASEFQKGLPGYEDDLVTALPLNDVHLQKSYQGLVRYWRNFGLKHQLTAETYWKLFYNGYPYITPYHIKLNPNIDNLAKQLLDCSIDKSQCGLEVLFGKIRRDLFYYSCSYALYQISNSYTNGTLTIDENFLGQLCNVSIGSSFARYHTLLFTVMFRNEKPYNNAVYVDDNKITYKKIYYQKTLDPAFTLQLHYSFSIGMYWGSITGYIELWNLFNQKTVLYRYEYEGNTYKEINMDGIIPVIGLKITF